MRARDETDGVRETEKGACDETEGVCETEGRSKTEGRECEEAKEHETETATLSKLKGSPSTVIAGMIPRSITKGFLACNAVVILVEGSPRHPRCERVNLLREWFPSKPTRTKLIRLEQHKSL